MTVGFGTWPDPTSRLIYTDALPALLSGVPRDDSVLDLGGANGLSRRYFSNVTTVDMDPSTSPDVVADIRRYTPATSYDRVLLRYVLHYLPDADVMALADHIAAYHYGPVHVVQFLGTAAKVAASPDRATRWMRSEPELVELLLADSWQVTQRVALTYDVHPDFYRYRCGQPGPSHEETTVSLTLERA